MRLKFSKDGDIVIIEEGCDEIMQQFVTGQNHEYEGWLMIDDDHNLIEETVREGELEQDSVLRPLNNTEVLP